MEDNFSCEFCGKTLSSNSNLKKHIKTSRQCLNLRGENISNFKQCQYCGYITGLTANFNRHLQSCRKNTENLTDEKRQLEDEILRLKTENNLMKELSTRPQIVNNTQNNTQNIQNNQFNITLNLQLQHSKKVLSPYNILEEEQERLLIAHFNKTMFKNGIKGLAKTIINKLLSYKGEQWIISYEPNKEVFHRKNEDEEIEIDDRAESFLESIMQTIKNLVFRHIADLMEDDPDEEAIDKIADSRRDFDSLFCKGTKERKKLVKMIADSVCTSEAALLIQSKSGYKNKETTKFIFRDNSPPGIEESKSNEWFASNDTKYQTDKKWKKMLRETRDDE